MSILNTLARAAQDSPLDIVGLVIFMFCWLGYEPFLRRISKSRGLITKDLSVVRRAWMREMTVREVKLYDSNLMAHAVNSATNFSSANLLLIAAVAGVLFGGHLPLKSLTTLGLDISSTQLFQIKMALVLICLSRGLLDFIWALRQMNYCAAAMGSLPENMDVDTAAKFTNAITNVLEPAMTSFSQGVRAYYFSLAATAWLWGPIYLALASIGAVALLGWRQSRSQSARGLRQLRELLEEHPYPTPPRPIAAELQTKDKNTAPHNAQGGY